MSASPAAPDRHDVRRRAVWLLPLLSTAAVLVLPLAFFARLPDPMPSHFGTSGGADAHLPRLVDIGLLTLLTAVVGPGTLAGGGGRSGTRAAVANGGAVFLLGIRLLTLHAALDATSWQAVSLPATAPLLAAGAALVAAGVGWWLGHDPSEGGPAFLPIPRIPPAQGRELIWSGGASRAGALIKLAPVIAGVGLGWVVGGLVTGGGTPPGTWSGLIATACVLLLLTGRVRALVGPTGVTVRVGWLGFPRLRVPLQVIEDVRVEDVNPMSYGGWGVRWRHGATALIVRSGPALRIGRRGLRDLVVTVDGADEAAAVLCAHIEAAGSARS